ncbi:AAA family ATPase [Janthinobacterium lividum]|uniref:AAA family ATPase n=1 Tax=Janthinobacterium lividum TaxID=29581 RepID=UPI000874D963|nr:AAA family ATPase [Janthinobacterium lividum]MCC7714172.1 AAA family ATPase [Janthinobacterium lividum]OEZ47045.1 septum site-determining protein MinD [Janthinobacterium lividum]WQE27898.1 AAA family ATPase [Janthinobacterium lividum]STQ98821.1 Cell division inhibitor MinD [Janthinobacterium lividum]
MKIFIISSNEKQLAAMTALLRERHPGDDIDSAVGSLERLAGTAEMAAPDVLLLAQPVIDETDLVRIERLASRQPAMAIILQCQQQGSDFLLQAMRAGVREVLPQADNGVALNTALQRIEDKSTRHVRRDGKIIAFVSCKGGSGATFLAANLAYALAQDKQRVALFDLNLQFGDAALFVSDQKPAATLSHVAQQIHRLDPSFLTASMVQVTPNFSILAAPEDPGHASDIKPEHIDQLLHLARHEYDFIVLDTGRGLDAVSVRALDHADMICPVVQATLPYIRDGKRLLQVFQSLEYPASKIHLILNRHAGADEIRGRDLETAYGQHIFHAMPNHYAVAAASVNQGVPVLKLAPGSPLAKSLQECARKLGGTRAASAPGLFSRLFQRNRPIHLRGETA